MSSPASLPRRLAAIMAADVVGYGRLMEGDESGTLERLKTRREKDLVPLLGRYSGRLVKLMGDGVLIEFSSAVNAVQCALELQERMTKANEVEAGQPPILLRIGLNVGDVIVEGSDLYGEGVNLAARLEAIADPGGIVASPMVLDHIRGKVEIECADLGQQRLKNISDPLRVYQIKAGKGGPASVSGINSRIAVETAKPSIAVLPFVNLSGIEQEAYFVDGIVEEVILELSRFRELLVIGRASCFAFRDTNLDIRTIAEKLNAQYIVTGSMKRADKRIRINAQLTDAASGAALWSERYDRELIDIFDLQEELAHTLAITVSGRVKLTAAERGHRRGTSNMSSYDWYLKGRSLLNDYPHANKVEECAKRAINLDPDFASAHALLAFSYCVQYLNTGDWSFMDQALPHGQKAIELDPDDAFANVSMGFALREGPRHAEGIRYAARAVELNPNDTFARMMHAIYLTYYDRIDVAIETMEAVLRQDPFPLFWWWDVYAMALAAGGRYADSLAASDRIADPQYWAHLYRAICHYHLGDEQAARSAVAKAREIAPDQNLFFADPFTSAEILERLNGALRALGVPYKRPD